MDGEKSSFRSQGSPVKCEAVYRDAIPTHTPTPTQTLTGTITESPTPTSTYTSTPTPTATTIPTPTDVPPLDSASYTYDGDGNLVKSVVNGVATFYPARHFSLEIGLTGDTQRKYYSANGQTIAVNENGILSWILTDHLGSISGTVDANGSPVSTLLYTAFGETRLENGATNTDYRYTGQREEAELGLYFYNARWYDPSLGRFIQPDSLVPNPGNPMDWDRYAYVRNNPMKYNDPSGHKACLLDENGGCDTFEEEVLNLIDEVVAATGSIAEDYDEDGYPETPDINASPVDVGTTIDCSQKTYVECFYSRELLDISTKMNIDQKQMALLIIAVYYDVRHRSRGLIDRTTYDTPFWDYYGEAPGNACFGGNCFKRQEVNYFAQGMYTKANGESRKTGLSTVYAWKLFKYWEMPSNGTLFWFDFGYVMYSIIEEGQ